jgi:hypothetical protein
LVAVRHYRRDILRRGIGGKEKLDWIDFQGFQQTRALIDESVSLEDGMRHDRDAENEGRCR